MNNVNLIGRLGKDPEMKYFESGDCRTSFSVAVESGKKPIDGEKAEPFWFDVQCWNKTAELAGEYLKKGDQVGISGRLIQDKWTDDQGQKRQRVLINCDRLSFVGGGKKEEAEPATAGAGKSIGSDYQSGEKKQARW